MRISICVGEYAKVPYSIAGLELSVYCIEELCFCMKENAFLLDASLMNDGLVNWIDKDCALPALAGELYRMVHKKGSLSAFVTMILEYTGLYDTATVQEVEQILKKGVGLNSIEKRKSGIDVLTGKKKYRAAVKGYLELLEVWEELDREGKELPAGKVRAAILHNLGVAYTGLMLYREAAECFFRAYETGKEPAEFLAYLAAKRMELSPEDYVAFTAGEQGSFDGALQLERKMDEMKLDWKLQPESLRLRERKEMRSRGDMESYRQETEQLLQAVKSSYRSSVGE